MKKVRNKQEKFWAEKYAQDYIKKNRQFDNTLGAEAWREMLRKVSCKVCNYLECGCNIGRNIDQLKIVLPLTKPSIIEISEPAFRSVSERHDFENAFKGAILDSTCR